MHSMHAVLQWFLLRPTGIHENKIYVYVMSEQKYEEGTFSF